MRRMHWKRLLLAFTILILISGSTYALNRVQVKRQAVVLYERAERAEAAAKTDPAKRDEALDLYEQYLKFRPKDEVAFRKYVRMIVNPEELDIAKLSRMADITSKFLREFPENPEERKLLVKVLYNKADLNGARENLAMLFRDPQNKNSPDLLEEAIKIEETEKKFTDALAYVDRAIETGGQDPERVVKFYTKALGLLRVLHKDTEAALRVDTLQKKQPYAERPDARVVIARHLIAIRDYPAAREHVKRALALKGGEMDPDVLLAAAEVEVSGREPQLAAAREYLERSFAIDPRRVATGSLLAQVLMQQGHRDEAIAVLTQLSNTIDTVKDDFYNTLDRLIDLKESVVSEKLMARMTPENTRPFVQQYFRGRLELVKGNWPQAKQDLEACGPFLSGLPEYHKKLRCDLGECYNLSQNPDQMLESYRLALKDDRLYYPAQLGYAEALVKLGRFRDAIPIYTDLVREVKALHPTLARLVLLDQISRPESARNWKAFEDALGSPPYSTEMMLLKAEALNIRGEKAQSREVLQQAAEKDPKNPAISLKAIRIGASAKISAEDAAKLIEDAEKTTGDSVDFRLAKVGILMSRAKKPSIAELQAIGTVKEDSKFPKPELHRLLFGLGDIANRQSDPAMKQAALDFFRKAADLDHLDLVARALIVDIAIALNQEAVWEKALREIGQADGVDGPIYNLGQIAIRLKTFTPGDKDTLRDLRRKAEGIQKKRPAWSRAYLALAQLDELEGLNESALLNLRKAIELGDKQEAVIRKVVDLFRERKMYDDAAVLLNKIHTEVVLPDDLQRFRAIMNLLTSDLLSQDVKEIDRFAPEDAPTYEMRLLRGTLLAALRDEAGAEKAFRNALEKVPTERPGAAPLEAWSSLVSLLVRTDKRDIARRAVEEAERKLQTDPPKTENLLTLAGINEAIGDIPAAEKFFREIVAMTPKELDAQKQLVLFLQRTGRMPEAEVMLKTLTTNPGQSIARWARRHLAVSLMMKRDAYQNRDFALKLTEQNLSESKDDIEDRKAHAIVLCADPARRAEGIQILAEYGRKFELTPDEFYFLTRLYFDQGRFHDATETLKFAIRHRPNISIDHLAGAVSLYLAMDDIAKAKETSDRLTMIAPKSWEAVREGARVLARTGNTAAAKDLILNAPNAQTEAFIPTRTGPLLDEIKCFPDVEQLYRKFLASAKTNGAHLPLATFLISQKRTDEAIDLAQKYEAQTHPVITGRILSSAVRAKLPSPMKVALVETWLNKKLNENLGNKEVYAALVGAMAEVRDAQGRFDEAIAEYEKALRLSDSDLITNNLAMLLALHKPARANEAKQMMDKLIGIRGPEPTFLDTRAVCSLVQGENMPAQAVKDLTLALAQRQRAVYYFHLAWAYDLQRLEQDKKLSLVKATQFGLTKDDLHAKEIEKYQEFYGRMAP